MMTKEYFEDFVKSHSEDDCKVRIMAATGGRYTVEEMKRILDDLNKIALKTIPVVYAEYGKENATDNAAKLSELDKLKTKISTDLGTVTMICKEYKTDTWQEAIAIVKKK